ncbi:MAG TPA: hypothetical protein VIN74_05005 [Candidatus Limnocylindria bacterium]
MAKGEGKGWAKGRTAANDPRIARNAEVRRGMTYESHIPPDQDRRRKSPPASIEWTPTLAYVVGLLATDGCQTDGRHIAFPSADRELVEILLRCLGKRNKIAEQLSKKGTVYYRTQIGDVAFCRWLLGVGITPRKSLTIGPLAVPDVYLPECARGLMEGDGSILNFTQPPTRKTYPLYRYERLIVAFNSASVVHLSWLRLRLEPHIDNRGSLSRRPPRGTRHEFWSLRYGKAASTKLLELMYRNDSVPRLERKWSIWESYRLRNGADGGT